MSLILTELIKSTLCLMQPAYSADKINDPLKGRIRTPASQQHLRSIISANDADSSQLAAPFKLETVFQTQFKLAYDETDGVELLYRTGVDRRTLYNVGNASSVFVGANDAGSEMLKDGDPKFQLGVVNYTCFGQQNNVVTIQSTVNDRSSDTQGSTTARFLCASPDMSIGLEYAAVTVKQMQPVSLLQLTELKSDERRFFFSEFCSNSQTYRLRSAVSGPPFYYLAVKENKSETLGNDQRCYTLCMKRFSGTDNDKRDLEIEFSWR
jgi:hypothetical protein